MYLIIKVTHRNDVIMEEDRMRGKKGLGLEISRQAEREDPAKAFLERHCIGVKQKNKKPTDVFVIRIIERIVHKITGVSIPYPQKQGWWELKSSIESHHCKSLMPLERAVSMEWWE